MKIPTLEEFIKLAKPTKETRVSISISRWGELDITSGVEIVKMDDEPAIFCGESNHWYWVAPLSTMEAEKCADGDFEYTDEYIDMDLDKI